MMDAIRRELVAIATVEPAGDLPPRQVFANVQRAARRAGYQVDAFGGDVQIERALGDSGYSVVCMIDKPGKTFALSVEIHNDNSDSVPLWYNYSQYPGGAHGASGLTQFISSAGFAGFLHELYQRAEQNRPSFSASDDEDLELINGEHLIRYCRERLPS